MVGLYAVFPLLIKDISMVAEVLPFFINSGILRKYVSYMLYPNKLLYNNNCYNKFYDETFNTDSSVRNICPCTKTYGQCC